MLDRALENRLSQMAILMTDVFYIKLENLYYQFTITNFRVSRMNKTANLFELILKTGGVLTLVLIIICFFDVKLFYSRFNINIEEYIGASDVVFAAIDKLLLLIVVLLIQLVIWLVWINKVVGDYKEIKDNNKVPTLFGHEFVIGRLARRWDWLAYWIIILGGLLTSVSFTKRFPENQSLATVKDFFFFNYLAAAWFVLSLQPVYIIWKEFDEDDKSYKKIVITAVVFVAITVTAILFQSSVDANRIIRRGNRIKIELVTNDNIKVQSTDTIRYIGHTGGSYFFWNKVTEETSIYNQDQIRIVKIK
jgi:hypothetical protein